jgi:hypothetical protein
VNMPETMLEDLKINPDWKSLPLFDRSGWQRLPFDAFAESIGERVEPADAEGEIYIGLEHLDPQDLHIRRWGTASDVTGTKLRFRKGDIIFGRRRAYQRKLAVAEMDGICSAHALVVRARQELVLPEFLSPTINWSTLKLEEFELPPIEQQRRIAEVLWAVDKDSESTYRTRSAALKARKTAHREVFLQGLRKNGDPSQPGGLPDGWHLANVGEACIIENRLRKPINSAERAQMQGEYPYYGPTGIFDYLNEYRVEGEYVLLGEDGDHFLKFDSWNMAQLARGRFNVNNHAHLLRGTDQCKTEWIYQYFKHRDITPFLSRQGSGRMKLQKAVLEKVPIPIPPIPQQEEILDFLRSIDFTIDQLSEHLVKTKAIRETLTNQFTV